MKASEVMTTGVITVGPSTLVQDVVMTLLSNRISVVPVVDHHGAIIGIISEADLIRRVEIGTEKRSKWRELVTGKCSRKQEFLKSQAVRASDVMTKPVITATPQMPLGELVSLFDKYRIKRLPVVDGEKIIGIVSRANLLQALALALGHEGVGEAA